MTINNMAFKRAWQPGTLQCLNRKLGPNGNILITAFSFSKNKYIGGQKEYNETGGQKNSWPKEI